MPILEQNATDDDITTHDFFANIAIGMSPARADATMKFAQHLSDTYMANNKRALEMLTMADLYATKAAIAEDIPDDPEALANGGKYMTDDEVFDRLAVKLGEAMAQGMSLDGALMATSLAAVRLFLRNNVGNPMDVHYMTAIGARRNLRVRRQGTGQGLFTEDEDISVSCSVTLEPEFSLIWKLSFVRFTESSIRCTSTQTIIPIPIFFISIT